MANAQANVVSLKYIAETTPGTTPAGGLTALRYKTADFNANINTTVSQEIRSDRATTDLVRTSASSEGSVAFELSAVEYEPFIQSALGGTFTTAVSLSSTSIAASATANTLSGAGMVTTNLTAGDFIRVGGFSNSANNGIFQIASVGTTTVTLSSAYATLVTEAAGPTVTVKGKRVRNGTTKKTFTIERNFTDLANEYMYHKGMMVSTMALNTASEAIIEGTFALQGRSTTIDTSSVAGTAASTTATSNSIMSAVANVGTIYENDTAITDVYFKSINLTTNNNLRNLTAIGNLYPVDINMGSFGAEFAMEAYFANSTLLSKYLAGTATALTYILTDDSGNSFVINAPNVKYSAGSLTGIALNSDVMVSLTGTALYDSTYGYMLQISYLPA